MKYEDYLGSGDVAKKEALLRLKELRRSVELHAQIEEWFNQVAVGGLVEVNSPEDAIGLVQALKGRKTGFDIETKKVGTHIQAGLLPEVSNIRMASFFDGGTAYVVDLDKAGEEWLSEINGPRLIIHNAPFEAAHILHKKGFVITNFECTMLADRSISGKIRSLSDVAKEKLGLDIPKDLQVSDWSREPLYKEQILYSALDAVIAYKLWEILEKELAEYEVKPSYEFFKKIVGPVVTQAKPRLDLEGHDKVVSQWQAAVEANTLIVNQAGLHELSKVATKQEWLTDRLSGEELLLWPRTDTGKLKTDKDTLIEYAARASDEAVRALSTCTTLSSYLSNLGESLKATLWEGHLTPSYILAGAGTGRFTCKKPNLQNMPRSGFKHLIIPPKDGWVFVSGDLSQIEMRVMAELAGEEVMRQAFKDGVDLHRLTASGVLNIPMEEVTKDTRQLAKAINFGLIFGMGEDAFRRYAQSDYGVTLTRGEASEAHRGFFRTYPAIALWQKEVVATANAYMQTRSTKHGISRFFNERQYTICMNHPVQSSAAEILLEAMLYVYEHAGPEQKIALSVYDELCLTCPQELAIQTAHLLKDAFTHAAKSVFPDMPLRGLSDIKVGTTWEEAGKDSNVVDLGSDYE